MNNSKGRYYAKNSASGSFSDITTLYDGVAVLKLEGLIDKGKPINVYNEQWINSQTEDFMITGSGIVRENVDIELTFIVKKKYATNQSNFNVQTVHDNFVSYMTGTDVWLKSNYLGGKYAHCVCLKEYKPTIVKLGRGSDSYIMGTITFHTLSAATS